jgi:hypothetical protein
MYLMAKSDEAYNAGYDAYHNGEPFAPAKAYPNDSDAAAEWALGYNDAKETDPDNDDE